MCAANTARADGVVYRTGAGCPHRARLHHWLQRSRPYKRQSFKSQHFTPTPVYKLEDCVLGSNTLFYFCFCTFRSSTQNWSSSSPECRLTTGPCPLMTTGSGALTSSLRWEQEIALIKHYECNVARVLCSILHSFLREHVYVLIYLLLENKHTSSGGCRRWPRDFSRARIVHLASHAPRATDLCFRCLCWG